MRKFTVAAIQMTSGGDAARNAARALELAAEAADRGASLIALPENWLLIRDDGEPPADPSLFEDGPADDLRAFCRARRVTMVAGTVPEAAPDGRLHNCCPVIGPDGEFIAKYRKIHLFDVEVGDGAAYRESKHINPGVEAVVAQTPCGPIGLSVCYDLRFPELYRLLARRGARVLFVPAAFTLLTGKDHWETLLRARAIENYAYVVAPGQFGKNTPKRNTYGRSLVADPWGVVIARAADRECVIAAEIDYDFQDSIRSRMPALGHINPWLFRQFE
ncbi:MAG TPA: carbon-nitrogen hydrolase family protein [bacterium]|nr:MAG: 2-oxoglutaramate amidase [bacterium ADurb.Bin236]HOY64382.1 carbon-nitrogen hydrolase family protein [bacterium]HPI78111.1 carbon-nitrogen hydrolase family protein [bacterium]